MATKTFTFPASQSWVDKRGRSHTITTSQTFTMDMTDDDTTAHYTGLGSTITTTDGYKFILIGDPSFSYMNVTADAEAVTRAGSLWFRDIYGETLAYNISSVTIDDADVPTSCTIILNQVENPMINMTWTSLTVA